jgi:hypothetical protein
MPILGGARERVRALIAIHPTENIIGKRLLNMGTLSQYDICLGAQRRGVLLGAEMEASSKK